MASERSTGKEAVRDEPDEERPLLGAERHVASTPEPGLSETSTLYDGHPSNAGNHEDDDKPLPRGQIFLLCYARWIEPIAFFSIFPYINQMAQRNGKLADEDVGFYSGLIESLFSLTQMAVMLLWGRAADRFGRKPVLVFSLLGVSCATSLFGMARTIWQMILFRCLAGFFAGTIVTIRAMIAEHSTARTQARAFSWFAFTGNMGIMFGPLIGGALADPASRYAGIFADTTFFRDYPYALSSFAVGALGFSAVITSALFLQETLEPKREGDESGGARAARPSIRDMIRMPGVCIVLYSYGYIMLLAFAYTAIVPVFWFTSVPLGGFGLGPVEISVLLAFNGLAQAIWILLVFPPLHRRMGTKGILRACAVAWPLFFGVCPLLNLVLRCGATTAFWMLAPASLAVGCGLSMAFTAIQLALNDVTPSPAVLATLNSVALAISSGVRAFSPVLFSSLFALGTRTQWLGGHAIWVLMIALAAGLTAVTRHLPDAAELKRGREGIR